MGVSGKARIRIQWFGLQSRAPNGAAIMSPRRPTNDSCGSRNPIVRSFWELWSTPRSHAQNHSRSTPPVMVWCFLYIVEFDHHSGPSGQCPDPVCHLHPHLRVSYPPPDLFLAQNSPQPQYEYPHSEAHRHLEFSLDKKRSLESPGSYFLLPVLGTPISVTGIPS